ncbi:HTH-type transcriptional activator AmpR [Serratia odorifera]|uniref:HTH-type transcriptional activator AmpR n=1 Tax=Serratia odorifera TaxID=618 RepID=A0A3S4DQB4_SEROD|nr:HTH-type transcriptional activator AmpR [Serratia odorifera]
MLTESFDRIESVLQQFDGGHFHEVLTVAAVGTFAVGWLMPRLGEFQRKYPFIDLRVMTHNNVINLAAEGLDFAICFGDGAWPATRQRQTAGRAANGVVPTAVGSTAHHAGIVASSALATFLPPR